MSKKKKNRYSNNIEPFNRHCPICGENIKKGTPSHRCNDKKIAQLEDDLQEFEKNLEKECINPERSYSDKMDESDYYSNENDDIDEEEL